MLSHEPWTSFAFTAPLGVVHRWQALCLRETSMGRTSSTEVLVVEDEADIREILRDVLEMEGYSVRCAANGKEALDVLSEMRPKLILLDLMMPVMSGYEFLQRIRSDSNLSTIPVTVVSAIADRIAVRDTIILQKPVDLDILLHVVDAQCGLGR
jgi:CheY-like chemotaxis protein